MSTSSYIGRGDSRLRGNDRVVRDMTWAVWIRRGVVCGHDVGVCGHDVGGTRDMTWAVYAGMTWWRVIRRGGMREWRGWYAGYDVGSVRGNGVGCMREWRGGVWAYGVGVVRGNDVGGVCGHVNWNRLSYNWGNSFELGSLDVWTWRKT